MAVGVSLAFMDANIFITAAAIGLATFTMVDLPPKAIPFLS
jgi:putative Mn2+ efflux pump MntP